MMRLRSLAIVSLAGVAAAAACSTPPKPPPPPPPPPAPAAGANALPSPIEAWREKPPAAGPSPAVHLPVFESAKLANGLTVQVSSVKSLPVVTFILVNRGGSALDPKGSAGLTWLAFKLLGEGAGKLGALDFSDAVADLGAGFDSGADQDSGVLTITGLTRNRKAMLDLLADAALRPRLEKKDFERLKALELADIVRHRGSPEGLAFEFVPGMIYGDAHPYGHPPTGFEATVSKLTLGAVKKQLTRTLVPGSSALIATGDITLEEAKTLAEGAFGKWKGKRPSDAPYPAVSARQRESVMLVHKDDAPQTVVFVGRPLFARGNPDEAAMQVTNSIFGGAFASRLNMNLREDKGYTYGARSAASTRRGTGAFYAHANIRQDVSAPGLEQFFVELRGLVDKPATSEEVDRAKDGIIRALPGDFERTDAVASAAAQLFIYELPLDYYAGAAARIGAVDPAKVSAMAKTYLVPETMQILLVGDTKVIQADIEKLNLGKLVVKRP